MRLIRHLKQARNAYKTIVNYIYIFYLRLHAISISWSACVDPTASLEPSDGLIKIGPLTSIDRGVIIRGLRGKIVVGENCSINAYSVLIGGGSITIYDNVRIAAHVVIVASNHVYRNKNILIKDQGLLCKGIVIHDDVWIGAGAKVLDGVILRKGTVVAAGSVVTKSTEPYTVVAGVPAKKIGVRE